MVINSLLTLKKDVTKLVKELAGEEYTVEFEAKRKMTSLKVMRLDRICEFKTFIVESIDNNIFLQASCTGDTSFLSESIMTQLLSSNLVYWIKYANIKKLRMFFDCYDEYPEKAKIIRKILGELNFVDCTEFSKMFDCENIYLANVFGLISKEDYEWFCKVLNFYSQIESLGEEKPDFILDSYNYNIQKSLYKINRRNYYYNNALFSFILENSEVKIISKLMPDKKFTLNGDTVNSVLNYIEEQMKIPNLLTPPQRHFTYLLKENLKINTGKIDIDYKLNSIENDLEHPTLETECAFINNIFYKHKNVQENNSVVFKVLNANFGMNIYKVITPNYIWYIANDITNNEFYMIPTKDNKKTPEKIIDVLRDFFSPGLN